MHVEVRETERFVFVDGVMYEKVVKEGNPGDLIYIVNPWRNEGYEKGDVLTVASRFGRGCFVKESDTLISFKEYVVLEPAEITSKKLSVNVTVDTTKIIERIEALIDELEGIKNGLSLREFEEQTDNVVVPTQRQHIIDKAKADVNQLLNQNYPCKKYPHLEHVLGIWFKDKGGYIITDKADFIVNKEKRTVVCLIKETDDNNKVHLKGIAKCAPNDCFNVHIGKAIALRRALGLTVPNEYLNAPQPKPEDMQPGDIVEVGGKKVKVFAVRPTHRTIGKGAGNVFNLSEQGFTYINDNGFERWKFLRSAKIIDDSRDE